MLPLKNQFSRIGERLRVGRSAFGVFSAACVLAAAGVAAGDLELSVEIKNSDVDGNAAYEFGAFGDAGLEVFRVSVVGLEPGDQVLGAVSDTGVPMTIMTNDPAGFFNAQAVGQGHGKPSPALFEAIPPLQWDTFLAIDDVEILAIGMGNIALEGGGASIVESEDSSWVHPGIYVPEEPSVLIGQFTHVIGNDFSINVALAIVRGGDIVIFDNLTFESNGNGEPPVEGACCLDGKCFMMTEEQCLDEDGEFDGSETCDEVDCNDEPPPPTEGACCTPNATCEITTAGTCSAMMGEFQGLGTTCDAVECGFGACCFEDECEVTLESFCLAFAGEWDGSATCDGIDCNGEPPPPTDGACCIMGFCEVVASEAICIAATGDWGGVGTTCGDIDCEPRPEEGACCTPFGLCFEGTEAACDVSEGEFAGVGVECDEIECEAPELEGACCIAGVCELLTEAACDMAGGEFDGSPTCDGVDCPVPDGVCCLLGACLPIDEEDCDALDGTFHPTAFSCADVICDPSMGACCVNGAAIVIFDWQCELVQGEFMGAGVFPDQVVCPDPPLIGCPGDLNDDGVVDIEDLIILLMDLGCECLPNCIGKACGDDGCGGSCGSCPSGFSCKDGQCLPGSVVKQIIGGSPITK